LAVLAAGLGDAVVAAGASPNKSSATDFLAFVVVVDLVGVDSAVAGVVDLVDLVVVGKISSNKFSAPLDDEVVAGVDLEDADAAAFLLEAFGLVAAAGVAGTSSKIESTSTFFLVVVVLVVVVVVVASGVVVLVVVLAKTEVVSTFLATTGSTTTTGATGVLATESKIDGVSLAGVGLVVVGFSDSDSEALEILSPLFLVVVVAG